MEIYLHYPNTPSWLGVQLTAQAQLNLLRSWGPLPSDADIFYGFVASVTPSVILLIQAI